MTKRASRSANEPLVRDPCADRNLSVAVPVTEAILLDTLPKAPPEVTRLEFTLRGEGWPPKPRGAEQVRRLHAQEAPGALTDELDRQLREIALRDDRVLGYLGERHVYVHSDAILPEKEGRPDCSGPLQTRLTYYSYDRQTTIEVLMRGAHVQDVVSREGYQPAETEEEILEAICLARSDPCLRDRVQLLGASAILLHSPPGADEAGNAHRTLWVTFFDAEDIEDEKPALFSAAVDLVDRVVLHAREEPPIGTQMTEATDA
jgi:hypothetical protein